MTSSMTGNTIVLALLAIVVVLGGTAYLLSRLLPDEHPVRKNVDVATSWIKGNPDLFLKRMQQVAVTLVLLILIVLTLAYS